jgi:hypothetical protein
MGSFTFPSTGGSGGGGGSYIPINIGSAKGDIGVYTGSAWSKIAAGTNGQVLSWDSTQTTGVIARTINDGTSFVFRQDWVSGGTYVIGDMVSSGSVLWMCNGNIVSSTVAPGIDAGWDLAVDPSGAVYRASSIIFAKGAGVSTVTTTSIGLNFSRACAIRVPVGKTISSIIVPISTGEASAVFRVGIYSNVNNYPGALLASGTGSGATSSTLVAVSISGSNITGTGLMWLAVKPETSAGGMAFTSFTTAMDPAILVSSSVSFSNAPSSGYSANSTSNGSGALASTFPAFPADAVSLSTPRLGVLMA